jgi:hypothetical protein
VSSTRWQRGYRSGAITEWYGLLDAYDFSDDALAHVI